MFADMFENDLLNLNLEQPQVIEGQYNLHPNRGEVDTKATPDDGVSVGTESSDSNQRYCWICLFSKEEDENAAWVQPCNCRGSTKWVHQACLQRWIDEKQDWQNMTKVSCPQCLTEYIISIPEGKTLVKLLDRMDHLLFRGCRALAGGLLMMGTYWIAVSHGAITLMQVFGHREARALMDQAGSFPLLIGLPAIPITLIVVSWIDWDDNAIKFIFRNLSRVSIIQRILPFRVDVEPHYAPPRSEDEDMDDFITSMRIVCGALLMPTIASFIGKTLFCCVHSNFQRTILGGATFVFVKGGLKLYHKYMLYTRERQRVILDYTDANIRAYVMQNRPLH